MNNRQSVNPTASVGLIPRAVQLEFDKEEKKIQQFDSTNKKFYRDVKNYVEKIDDLIKNENKMISNLTNLAFNQANYSADSKLTGGATTSTNATSIQQNHQSTDSNEKDFIEKLKSLKELSSEHVKSSDQLKQACISHVIDPMKNLNLLFPLVNTAIKKRETSYKELVKLQEKLEKAQEKERTGQNLVKINDLNTQVQLAKHQFQKENSFLMEELPKLYHSRIDYIRPCVSSLINSQLNFYNEYSKFYEKILNKNETTSLNSSSNNEHLNSINMEIQASLNEIKSLSIVSGD